MEFVHPEILWGLAALAIPVIIHLLNFRRYKRVAFSHVAFLQQVERQTRSTQRLKHLLVLLARLIAVAGLVLAFAQPFTPPPAGLNQEGTSGAAISLYIDNSLSMQAEGERGPLLQTARDKAAAIVEQYGETDRFHVFTPDFAGRDQRLLTRDQALERISEIAISPAVQPLDAVLRRAEDALAGETDKRRALYVFSDLQRNTHRLPIRAPGAPDSALTAGWPLAFVPGEAGGFPNVWVDSVWFDTPMRMAGAAAALHVRLRHNAASGADGLPIALELDGRRAAIGTFNLVPGMATDTTLRFTHGAAGWRAAKVVVDDAPVQFDDALHFGFQVAGAARAVGFTDGANAELTKALSRVYGVDEVDWEVVQGFEPEALEGRDLAVVFGVRRPSSGLAAALVAFAEQGGTVVVVPDSAEVGADGFYRNLLNRIPVWEERDDRVQALSWEHPLFKGVFGAVPERPDLPKASRVQRVELGARTEILAELEQGGPFLSGTPTGRGYVYMFHADLASERSNFSRHALWVPTWLRFAERARATPVHAATLGQSGAWRLPVEGPLTDEPLRLVPTASGGGALLPAFTQIRGVLEVELPPELDESGPFRLMQGDSLLAVLGVNHDRRESDPAPYTSAEWQTVLEEAGWEGASVWEATESTVGALVNRFERGKSHWQWMLALALLALLSEILLLQPWKKTS
jgi:hypothetical protein